MHQMEEDDLEDFWRDNYTKPKQVYQGLINHPWCNPNIVIQHYNVLMTIL